MSVRPEFARALAWTRLASGLRAADHDLFGSISMVVALAFDKASDGTPADMAAFHALNAKLQKAFSAHAARVDETLDEFRQESVE